MESCKQCKYFDSFANTMYADGRCRFTGFPIMETEAKNCGLKHSPSAVKQAE